MHQQAGGSARAGRGHTDDLSPGPNELCLFWHTRPGPIEQMGMSPKASGPLAGREDRLERLARWTGLDHGCGMDRARPSCQKSCSLSQRPGNEGCSLSSPGKASWAAQFPARPRASQQSLLSQWTDPVRAPGSNGHSSHGLLAAALQARRVRVTGREPRGHGQKGAEPLSVWDRLSAPCFCLELPAPSTSPVGA